MPKLRLIPGSKDTNKGNTLKGKGTIEPTYMGQGKVDGLTARQAAFAANVAAGMTLVAAYDNAFDRPVAKRGSSQSRGAATKLAKRPEIVERVAALKRLKMEDGGVELHDATKLREFVLAGLKREASEADNAAARIRAMELLGKVDTVGLFRERIEQDMTVRRTEAEVKDELVQRLTALAKGSSN